MAPDYAPDSARLAELGEAALAEIPAGLREQLDGLALQIAEFPDDDTLAELGAADAFEILGLYTGVSPPEKQTGDTPYAPDQVYLYRRPILDVWVAEGWDLYELVRNVLIHEIGHHFGLSDADMAALEAGAD